MDEVPLQIGMWNVSSLPNGKVQTLHWNGDFIVKMESPWYDTVKFAAAMIVHSQVALTRTGSTGEEAKKTVFDRLDDELFDMIKVQWDEYERRKGAER